MVEAVTRSPALRELDAMIGRAEAACERYRRRAERRGLPPPLVARRRKRLRAMEATLTRAKRAVVAS
jgi:hypothetical protein